MSKARLEAFSDGVFAILITILVLELHLPRGDDFGALLPILPVFLTYTLSFIFLGIYWNNHHHMLHLATRINGQILWANLHLLFWLSLIPFTTGWMGQNHTAPLPAAVYGFNLLMSGVAYGILESRIIADQGEGSKLCAALGSAFKEKLSSALYLAAIGLAFVHPWIADLTYLVVAALWLLPDTRIESTLKA